MPRRLIVLASLVLCGAALPALANRFITFACLCNFCKVNDGVLRLWSTADRATPKTAELTTAAAPPVGASTTAKKPRAKPIERFPLKFHYAITIAMGNSLKRLTGDNSLLSESDIGRLALHNYLLANDPLYIRAMRGNGSNA